MPTFDNPRADANEARQALGGLSHATRSIDDPAELYSVLGSLAAAATSLEQALHRLTTCHDDFARERTGHTGADRSRSAAVHQVSWELHRTGEILRHVAASLDHAHDIEGTIAYTRTGLPPSPTAPRPTPSQELSL